MRFEQKVAFAFLSDLGMRRKNNEDASAVRLCADIEDFRKRGHLLVVADGMGGHAVGELASKLCVETLPHTFLRSRDGTASVALVEAVVESNRVIHTHGMQNREFMRMGTTCTALALTPQGAMVGHVGDSRCYRIRRDRIDQLTFDHSLQWEMQRDSKNKGLPSDYAEHKNVITRSLGPEKDVEVDLEGPTPILPGDVYVLCSDGLSGPVADEEIGAIARDLSPAAACQLLVHLANLRGGADNSTVIIARIGDPPANVTPIEIDMPPEEAPVPSWGSMAAWWAVAGVFAAGVALLITRNLWPGIILTGGGGVALGALVLASLRRKNTTTVPAGEGSGTTISRPHRTAVALSSQELCTLIAETEGALRQQALTEKWKVDWSQHQSAIAAATSAVKEKRYGRAVRDYARAVDVLIDEGLLTHRKTADAVSRN